VSMYCTRADGRGGFSGCGDIPASSCRRAPVLKSYIRIVVVGALACGKTTFARALSRRFGIPHIELDTIKFKPQWVRVPWGEFRTRVEDLSREPMWVIDGNYEAVRDTLWSRAQLAFWLDYSLPRRLGQLVSRTARRLWRREEFANGNYERIGRVFSRRSAILWAVRKHYAERRELKQWFADPRYSHLHIVRLRSPQESLDWVRSTR
jgi:adenylate kinase family enzyme